MSQNNVYVRFKTLMGTAVQDTKKLSNGYDKLHSSSKKLATSQGKVYNKIRKNNDSFSKLSKDANRASSSIGKLGGKFLSLGGIMKGISAYAIGDMLFKSIQSTIDMTETINLFNVAMGDMAESTNETLESISGFTGLDVTNLQDRVGTYNLLARSMGLTSENSKILSENTARLALDLSSLTNVSINQVSADLRSGLVGQSETMYKYGVDVTEAALKTEALNQGISKSVREMSQGEKMALRYSVMIRQTGLSHGDFANTINNPANQLKILADRFVTLGRAVGTMFMPVLSAVLPYLNAIVTVLTKIILRIGLLLGYKPSDVVKNTTGGFGTGLEEVEESADGATRGIAKTAKAAKKLKQQLAGFDEINTLGSPDTPDTPSGGGGGGGGIGGGGGSPFDLDLIEYDSMLDSVRQKSDDIAASMEAAFDKIAKAAEPTTEAFKRLWNEGLFLLNNFAFHSLLDFFNNFLVPIGVWNLGEGIPRFIDALNKMLKDINWGTIMDSLNGLWAALVPFQINVGKGLLWFWENVLTPLGSWTMNNVVPIFIDTLASAIGILDGILTAFKPVGGWLWDNFLLPLAQWTGNDIVNILEAVGGAMKFIKDNIEDVIPPLVAFTGVLAAGKFLVFIGQGGSIAGAFTAIGVALKAMTIGKVVGALDDLYLGFLVAKDGAKILFKAVLEEGKMFIDWGKDIASTVTKGIKSFGEDIIVAKDGLIKFGTKIAESTVELAKQGIEFIKIAALKVWDTVKTIAMTVATAAWTAVTTLATAAGTAFGAVLTFLTSPIGLVIIAVIALIAIGVALYKNWDSIKAKASEIWGKIKVVLSKTWDSIKEYAAKTWDSIKNMMAKVWDNVKKVTLDVWNSIKTSISKVWDSIKDKAAAVWDSIKNMVSKVWDSIKNVTSNVWNGIKQSLSVLWDSVKEKSAATWDSMKKKIEDIWGKIKLFFTETIPEIIRSIVKWFSELPSKVGTELNKIAGTIRTWVSNAVGWVKAEVPKIINKIVEFMASLPAKIKAQLDKFKSTLSTWVRDGIGWVKIELPKLLNNILNWFAKLPSALTNVGKNMIRGIWNGMSTMGSWLLNKFSGFFGGAWKFVSDIFSGFGKGISASFSPNVKLARGGSLSAGQYFEAGEGGKAELIGSHQGKTTVMPLENSSFVGAMKNAVIEGVTVAMGSSGGSGGTPIVVNVGGKTLVDTVVGGINRENRINGRTIITV